MRIMRLCQAAQFHQPHLSLQGVSMFKHPRFQTVSILAVGALLGHVLAASDFRVAGQATGAAAPSKEADAPTKPSAQDSRIAQAVRKAAAARQTGSSKKP